MDPGRYGHQQGWDNNSALEGHGAFHEPNYRTGGSYDNRRFINDRYSRDNVCPRNAFHRDSLERENYPPPAVDVWPQSRRRSYEEEYPIERESRRHERPYFDSYHDMDAVLDRDGYHNIENYRDHKFDRASRFGEQDHDDYAYDDYDYKSRTSYRKMGDSCERDYEYGRHSYDSDYERGRRRDGNWRRRESHDRERDKRALIQEKSQSPHRWHEQSRSRGYDDHPRSRSPRSRSQQEDSYDDGRHERNERRDREDKRHPGHYDMAPSATVVVKGLSQKMTDEDLYQILDEWGPLRHVRVIKEKNSGISRGFAFIDFPSVGAACAMMDRIRDDGLVVDGRKLFFEYSKPTGGAGGPFAQDKSGQHRKITVPSDWMCNICGCVNFARRPTHVLVVRGLDENADEEMLRYEFSKHAPIKDLRLVRDKFTHVSRGFAFVHFHSVKDATKALDSTNGTSLEKNGQILRVAYAKSILGPGTSGPSQSSSLAAAAIEAAAFSLQYDAVGWAPKEYNPDDNQSTGGQEQASGEITVQKDGSAPQSGFVWDEASGYYYDAASGFYFDGNTGLYYDGNQGVWYSYDQQTQQYIPFTDNNDNKASSYQVCEFQVI
uniref:RRM domain-containing protein n=1 Tax=Salix viminalis TaxID=40686 RepID=A0A6N2NDV3_SALVM